MRFIKQQISLWRIALIIGAAAFAIPIASRVSPTATAVVKERQAYLDHQRTAGNHDAYPKHSQAKHSKDSKAAVGPGVARPQDDDYYDRRREYWDRRVERRLDRREEYLDEQTRDDKDDADTKDSKNNQAGKDDADDEEDSADSDVKRQEDEIERRREYWRKRLDRDW
jgi:hypothetical protein